MWKRFVDTLRCPSCQGEFDLVPIDEYQAELSPEDYAKGERLGIKSNELCGYVESGILLCKKCEYWFPILNGLPVLLPYETPTSQEFLKKYKKVINDSATRYTNPTEPPRPGEYLVLSSFSKEWLEYEYDGVIWGWSYEDREKTLITEIGLSTEEVTGVKFLEIGCGLGVTTRFAEKNYKADAVGVDLSLSVLRAADYFRSNPFLHFVQATLFQLPLRKSLFDLVYSHGVLHHCHSTKEAFKAIMPYCKPGGWTYIWIYGRGGQTNSWDRKLGHLAEVLLRPFLSRAPTPVTSIVLMPLALSYIILNAILRLKNPTLQAYNFRRALHAARDRFTPRFAHRHDCDEVETWFREFGFDSIQRLDWRLVPQAVNELFRGAVGVRGQRQLNKDLN